MPTPIEQALISLVPTLNTLPQELIDLSSSLLAQSRSKAATLKPEEEIGRTYACAHIAVDRLKQRLDVDKVVANPPVPPRVYKKLYGYLDAALGVSTPRGTPRTQRVVRDVGTPGSRGRGSGLGTPSKVVKKMGVTPARTPVSASKTKTPVSTTKTKTPVSTTKSVGSAAKDTTASGRQTRSAAKECAQIEQEVVVEDKDTPDLPLPVQAAPIITAICAALEAPQASAHITSAITAILSLIGYQETEATTSKKRKSLSSTPASKRRRTSTTTTLSSPPPQQEGPEAITPDTLPAILVALSLLTTFTLRNTIINGTAYATARSTAADALDPSPTSTSIDSFLHTIKSQGWLELPWFMSVQQAAITTTAVPPTPKKDKQVAKTPLRRKEKHAPRVKDLDPDLMHVDEDEEEEEEEEEEREGAGLMWGLGTMFQNSVDWLSRERRREYKVWEKDVRTRCDEIDAERQIVFA